jgi:hypothetical protein
LLIAHTARHLGDICREIGLTEQAGELLEEAINIYRHRADTKACDLANSIRPLALLKTAVGDLNNARPLWEEARALYAAVNVTAGVAECSGQLAKLHRAT